jgi:hypothetical protein
MKTSDPILIADLRIQAIEHFEHLDPKEVSEQMIEDEIALRLSLITHTEN